MMDGQGCLSFWNQMAEQIFGWANAEALGQNVYQLLKLETETAAAPAGAAPGGSRSPPRARRAAGWARGDSQAAAADRSGATRRRHAALDRRDAP